MSVLAVYDCMLFFMQAARPDRVRETFELVQAGKVTYCLSPQVISEILDVLTRPKHQKQFPQLTTQAVEIYLQQITRRSKFVQNVPEVYHLKRDPKDSKYVNLAIAANAPYLVTRDLDLLDLMKETNESGHEFIRRFPNLRILDPGEFVRVASTVS